MTRTVRRLAATTLALTLLAVLAPALADAQARKGGGDLVKRGEYLVNIGSCNDCHTPWRLDEKLGMPVPDTSRRLSGHPADAPDPAGQYTQPDTMIMGATFTSFRQAFGTVYAANLTPDATGLGAWTEDQFIRAMRTGRKMGIEGGPPILPPMPWPNIAHATDDDLRAIFAYLKSLPPISNAVPQNKVNPEAMKAIGAAYDQMAAMHGGAPPKGKGTVAPPRKK
jgi:cytochrome c553